MIGRLKLIACAAAVAGAFAAGWISQGWRADAAVARLRQGHAEVLAAIATKTQAAADAVRAYEFKVGEALAAADSKHTQELAHEKLETQRLRECVRNRTCGVRLVTVAADKPGSAGRPDATTGSLGDAAGALDVSVSERVLDLRDAIAADAAALGYLQQYAQQCRAAGAMTGD